MNYILRKILYYGTSSTIVGKRYGQLAPHAAVCCHLVHMAWFGIFLLQSLLMVFYCLTYWF